MYMYTLKRVFRMEHLVVTKRTVDFQNNIRTLSILRNLDSGQSG